MTTSENLTTVRKPRPIKRAARDLMALDAGMGRVKAFGNYGLESFPHALLPLSAAQIINMGGDGMLDNHPSIFNVNGKYYAISEFAISKGSGVVRTGEYRYTADYYGVLAAIMAFLTQPDSHNNLFLYGGHAPKDKIYRQNLIDSVIESKVGAWTVKHRGQTKVFSFTGAKGYHEPVGVYRFATMSEDGKSLRAGWLRSGFTAILDIGAFTTDCSVAEEGRIDYDSTISHAYGFDRVIDEMWTLIKHNNPRLKGFKPTPESLRAALRNPAKGLDARGYNWIPCVDEAKQVIGSFMRELSIIFENYGGVGAFHHLLLGGGGSAQLHSNIKKELMPNGTYLADSDVNMLFACGVRGALAAARALDAKGLLDQ